MLDSRDIVNISPGKNGKNRWPHITTSHYISDRYDRKEFNKGDQRDFWKRANRVYTVDTLYNVVLSVKMRCLLGYGFKVCVDEKNKLLVFCNWPLNQWYVETCLITARLEVLSIRSAHTVSDRNTTIAVTNDPDNESQILATSYRCSATSLNL